MRYYSETTVGSTKKPHRCNGCTRQIEPQSSALKITIIDGYAESYYFHPECRDAEIGLNALRYHSGDDDWTSLDEADREDYPWLKMHHPRAYRRLLLTSRQFADFEIRRKSILE